MTDPAAAPRPWRARVSRLLLVCGLALAAAQLVPPLIQQEQPLRFDWETNGPPVSRIDLTWEAADDPDLRGGARLLVPTGHSGPLSHTLSVPEGPYRFTVRLERATPGGAPVTTTYRRRVTLEGHETTIRLYGTP